MNLTGLFELFTNPAGMSVVLIDYALKGSIILALALLLTGLLRKASASTRHLILSVAFIGLLLLPASARILPSWEMALLPDFSSPQSSRLATNEKADYAEPDSVGLASGTKHPDSAALKSDSDGGSLVTSSDLQTNTSTGTQATGQPLNILGDNSSSTSSLLTSMSIFLSEYWQDLLYYLWLSVSAALLLWVVVGMAQIAWITASAQVLSAPRWQTAMERACRELGVRSNVRLAMSNRISYPMVWGILHMTIVLPVKALKWDDEKLRIVLLHELSHVKRRDNLIQMIAHLILPIFWFNPLAWLAARRLQKEQENACDDLVLRAGIKPSDYALGLMEIAGILKGSVSWAAAAMARNTKLKGRIMSILNPATNRQTASRIIASIVCVGAVIILMPVASAYIWQDASTLNLPQAKDITPLLEEPEYSSPVEIYQAENSKPVKQTITTAEKKSKPRKTVQDKELDLDRLIVQLKSSDPHDRAYAAFLISMIESRAEKAIPALVALLGDDTEIYVNFSYRNDHGRSMHQGDTTPGRQAGSALGAIGKAAFDSVIPVLKNENDHARENAVRALRYMRDERALEHVGPMITDKNPNVRIYVIRMMREMRNTNNVKYLKKVVTDKNEEVQTLAVRALRELRTAEATKAVFPALKANNAEVRTLAVRTLRENMSKEAANELTNLLSDPEKETRILAIRALREFRDPSTVAAIIPFLKDNDMEVRLLAVRTLRENRIPESIKPLTLALSDPNKDVQVEALRALREFRSVEAVPALVNLLGDEDDAVRELAVRTLREMGDERAVPALSKFHADPNPAIRELALRALREQRKAASFEAIVAFLNDEKASIRMLAIRALMELGDNRAEAQLIRILNDDPDKEVRRMAARAIGNLK